MIIKSLFCEPFVTIVLTLTFRLSELYPCRPFQRVVEGADPYGSSNNIRTDRSLFRGLTPRLPVSSPEPPCSPPFPRPETGDRAPRDHKNHGRVKRGYRGSPLRTCSQRGFTVRGVEGRAVPSAKQKPRLFAATPRSSVLNSRFSLYKTKSLLAAKKAEILKTHHIIIFPSVMRLKSVV